MTEANGREEHEVDEDSRSSRDFAGEEWLRVSEAAQRLGVSARAVQLQAQQGKIGSRREGNRLLVCLTNVPDVPSSTREVCEEREVRERSHEAKCEVGEAEANPALMAQLRAEIAFLRAERTDQQEPSEVERLLREELAYMKARVEQHEQAEGELRRLMLADKTELQALRQKVALLIAPPGEEPTPQASPLTPEDTQDAPKGIERQEGGTAAGGAE